jgi:hypothetical protein
MTALGDVLELIHLAHSRPDDLQVTIRHWADGELWRHSAERWAAIRPGGSRTVFGVASGATVSRFSDDTYRVWRRLPGPLWRVEVSGSHDSTTILNGRRWWGSSFGGGFVTNVRPDGSVDDRVGGQLPNRLLEIMFDPAFIAAIAVITVTGPTRFAGRAALGAIARPRRGRDFVGLDWPYADEFRLVVDAEFGMLLRHEAVLDRQPFIMSEVTDVSFGPSRMHYSLVRPMPSFRPSPTRGGLEG